MTAIDTAAEVIFHAKGYRGPEGIVFRNYAAAESLADAGLLVTNEHNRQVAERVVATTF